MERVDADLVPFAQNNPSGYRFAFGTDTATDDINVNYNDNIKKGWGTTPNEFPEVEDFNAFAYTSGYLTAYLYQMGIAEWNDKQKYKKYSRVIGSDGKIYKAKTGTDIAPNVNNNPTTDTTNWEDVLGDFVSLTGDQTIAGIKTFLSFPITPSSAPTTNYQVANKKYVDDNLVASSETVAGIIELATTAEAQAGTDDLKAITSLKLKNSVIGLGQTLQTFTVGTQRIAGTTYTNTSGKPIWIIVAMASGAGAALYITAGGELREVSVPDNGGTTRVVVPVLNGETYSATSVVGTINYWAEIR